MDSLFYPQFTSVTTRQYHVCSMILMIHAAYWCRLALLFLGVLYFLCRFKDIIVVSYIVTAIGFVLELTALSLHNS